MAAAKTTAQKLTAKPGDNVFISDADRAALVGDLPEGAARTEAMKEAAVAVLFVDDAASTRAVLSANKAALAAPRALWIAYPKANKTDINRDKLWPIAGEFGLVPNSQVAIDEVWSALRFRPAKEGEVFAPGQPKG